MTKYRILEKEGIQNPHYQPNSHVCGNNCGTYIPRFIVQEEILTDKTKDVELSCYFQGENRPLTIKKMVWDYKDLKEFTSLDEARKYKHSLELKEGIVRE